EAVRHMRAVTGALRKLHGAGPEEIVMEAKRIGAPADLLEETARHGRLPVVNFAAGGIATPADAALMMQLGCDGIFVGSGIFKAENPSARAKAIVAATTYFDRPDILADASKSLGKAMHGLEIGTIPQEELLASRGWGIPDAASASSRCRGLFGNTWRR